MILSTLLNVARRIPGYGYFTGFVEDFLIEVIKTGPIPNHIAFVLDGNRRYAKSQGWALKDGHTAGAETLAEVLNRCFRIGVKAVTVYAFSIENFNRPQEEIDTLFDLLKLRLIYLSESEGVKVTNGGVKIKIIGNRSLIPPLLLQDLEEIEDKTKDFTERTLFVAFPYTSRDDIAHSISSIIKKVDNNELNPAEITESTIEDNFYWVDKAPKVDILVRTSGHTRLSDYMLWQCHQESVIEYVNTLWPNFRFFNTWWVIFKWGYYKNLIIKDAETMELKKANPETIKNRYKDNPKTTFEHPPFASVTKM